MKTSSLLFCGARLVGLFALAACVPQGDSLSKIDPNEPDPVQPEIWNNSIYTGPGSTHGITAPRQFLGILGPRKTSINLTLSKQIPSNMQGFNWNAVNERVNGLKTAVEKKAAKEKWLCARGVKDTLSMLLGTNKVDGDGIDACEVTESYLNKKFSRGGQFGWQRIPMSDIAKNGLKPGDVIACNRDLPGQSWEDTIPCEFGDHGDQSGHIEFVDGTGRLSSDFRQMGSGCLSNNRYQLARVYRMNSASALSMMPFYYDSVFKMLIPLAQAELPKAKEGSSSTVAKNKTLIAKTAEYAVFEEDDASSGDADSSAFSYRVYHKQNDGWTAVSMSDISAFHALEKLNDKAEQKNLAKLLVERDIKEFGRERLQQKILNRVMFSSCEKDAYITAGFKIPEFYQITQ